MKLKLFVIGMHERLSTLFLAACWTVIIAVAAMSALGLHTALVAGASMQPTLADGDMVLLRTYGYTLRRGDIVVFQCDALEKNLIKRVIGLSGDTIELFGTDVYRNGKRLDESYSVPDCYNMGDAPQVYHIGEGHVFVLGDNRPISCDSRYDAVGQVDTDDIVGVCVDWGTPPELLGTVVSRAAAVGHALTDAVHFSTHR